MAGSPPPYSSGSAPGASVVGSAAVDLGAGAAGAGAAGAAADVEGASTGTTALLRNIQRLLKVAAENARAQERQVDLEKGE